MKKNSLYRLSALIYRDNSNSLNRAVTISKVVESYFVIKSNKPISFELLSNEIKNEFSLMFHDTELENVVKSEFFLIESSGEEDVYLRKSKVHLCQQRYRHL